MAKAPAAFHHTTQERALGVLGGLEEQRKGLNIPEFVERDSNAVPGGAPGRHVENPLVGCVDQLSLSVFAVEVDEKEAAALS
ncbi:hypothetical protein D3C81_1221860 [compost metagenome]